LAYEPKTGALSSLKQVKKEVTEIRKDGECGMCFDEWEGFAVGDTVQCYTEIKEQRKL
jgi:translation initiation factor IF-2